MSEIRFLVDGDTTYIKANMRSWGVHPIEFDRGFIMLDGDNSYGFVIMRGGPHRHRLKTSVVCTENDNLYPLSITKPKEYEQNFAFDEEKEREIFNWLKERYEDKQIDAKIFSEIVDLATKSRKDLTEEVNYSISVLVIAGAVIGVIGGLTSYYFRDVIFPQAMQQYINLGNSLIAGGWIGGLLSAVIALRRRERMYDRLKADKIEEMKSKLPSLESIL